MLASNLSVDPFVESVGSSRPVKFAEAARGQLKTAPGVVATFPTKRHLNMTQNGIASCGGRLCVSIR